MIKIMGFRNVVLPENQTANPMLSESKNNIPKRGYFIELEAGAGSKTFKMDERGMWMGASNFGDAPFRIDMDGNFYLYASSGGGYIQISADLTQIIVNDGTNDRILIGRQEGGF